MRGRAQTETERIIGWDEPPKVRVKGQAAVTGQAEDRGGQWWFIGDCFVVSIVCVEERFYMICNGESGNFTGMKLR